MSLLRFHQASSSSGSEEERRIHLTWEHDTKFKVPVDCFLCWRVMC